MKYEEAILNGEFDCALLNKSNYIAQINDIIKISVESVYQSREVVEKEIAGYRVLADLLHVFIMAINNTHQNRASNYDKLILHLLPESFKDIKGGLYTRLLSVCSFVSNMSDSFAILLFNKIKGIGIKF